MLINKSFLAANIFGDTSKTNLITPIVLLAASVALSTFVISYYRGVDRFKEYSALQVLFQIMTVMIIFESKDDYVAQLQNRGIAISVVSVFIIVSIMIFTYGFRLLRSKKIKSDIKTLLGYCVPRVPGEFFLFAFLVAPLIVISDRFGAEAAAGFAVAIVLTGMINPFYQLVGTVLLPYVSRNLETGKSDLVSAKIQRLRHVYVLISVASIIFMLIFTNLIIKLLFSTEYESYATIVRVVFISTLPNAIYLLLRNPIDAASKFPHNTINLGISFIALMAFVYAAPNVFWCSVAFPFAYLLLAVLSELSWKKFGFSHE
jgi:O-antigen/teichoic acid export membrane protein